MDIMLKETIYFSMKDNALLLRNQFARDRRYLLDYYSFSFVHLEGTSIHWEYACVSTITT